MRNMKSLVLYLIILNLSAGGGLAQTDIYDSGGPVMPEQSAYNVTFYDLTLKINPADSSIDGKLRVDANIVHPVDWFVLDLDTLLEIQSIEEIRQSKRFPSKFRRHVGKVWIDLEGTRQPGQFVSMEVVYGGQPRVAPNPPWNSGFTWSRTADGADWIATTSWASGADVWWPCKDHISDSPDSMALHITVPDPLIVVSNGAERGVQRNADGTSTYHWFVSTPIDVQNVALNIAPYKVIEEEYESVAGDRFPVSLWILPEKYDDGVRFFPQIIAQLRFFEETLGPYPFRADKYGVAHVPFPGNEHQTIIAYGSTFVRAGSWGEEWGVDLLHQHELAHEWWGNLVTNLDWRDMWLHEGFGSYMQPLYLEHVKGVDAYHTYMAERRNFWNIYPVAPRISQTTHGIYKSPIYSKGSWVLHTLRYLIGDASFRIALRKMVYPEPMLEKITDGTQTRYASTDDFLRIVEQVSGMDLDWFFDVYLRQPHLPVLVSNRQDTVLKLRWEVAEGLPFPMPIEVKIGERVGRIHVPASGAIVKLHEGDEPEIDPEHWVLRRTEYPELAPLPVNLMAFYVGRYELRKADKLLEIQVITSSGRIFIQPNGLGILRSSLQHESSSTHAKSMLEIFPETKTKFYFREAEHASITFDQNEDGKVVSLIYLSGGQESVYTKVE